MTNAYEISDIAEFRELYDSAEVPALPARLSHYRFISCLADGENKKTWLLENANGQKVLCKFARGAYMTMLQTESTFFTLGKFPFIPYVFNYFEAEDGAYLLREYIEGPTLSELVEKNGPLSLEDAVPVIKQICGFLSRFHAADPPIIYRDLKPANIVLHPSGDCYLIDMGTARTYQAANDFDTVYFGTPYIAAPEQFGARQTDSRTDIYALGILFYFLLTGELKIEENKLKKLPKKAASLIRKCTAFDPERRYSEVSKVESDLAALRVKKNSHRRLIAAAAVCCALFAGGLFLFSRYFSQPVETTSEIVFSSPLLEEAVREELGKTDRSPIYESDLEQITRLMICGNHVISNTNDHTQTQNYHRINSEIAGFGNIGDISLLAKMPNLQYVVLDYQNIKDISPLTELPLVCVSLCGNPFTDLSPLQDQSSLQELYISETQVTSLDALTECASLWLLDCSYSPISSLQPLADLPIRSLYAADISATNWAVLESLPLQMLYCAHLSPKDYAHLNNIPTLRGLSLSYSGIASFHDLSGLYYLDWLDVRNNLLENLDGLENFTHLTSIDISDNPITDLSPLTEMYGLHSVDIATGVKTDFSFLNEMPWVTRVKIKASQINSLYEAVGEPWFELIVE